MQRNLIHSLLLWKSSQNRLPLILKGARQVGKTYLLKEFATQNFSKYYYFNFEEQPELKKIFEQSLDPDQIINNLKINKNELIKNSELIIFDEIQQCPRALTALKYFAEKAPQVFICSAGSLLGVTLSEESFPVGKVNYLYLTPFKFSEYMRVMDPWGYEALMNAKEKKLDNYQHQKLLEYYSQYAVVGGLPKAVQMASALKDNKSELFHELAQFHDAMIRSYQSDYAKHAGNINAVHIVHTFDSVPIQLSKNIDGSTSRFTFKDVAPKLRGFSDLQGPIEWLIKAGLIYKVKILKKAQFPLESFCEENIFKLYHFDTGLMLRMLKIPYEIAEQNNYGMHKGFVMENTILSQMISSDLDTLYCWQESKAEVDFVSIIFNKITPIEVKSSHRKASKSLGSFQNRYKPPVSVILSTNNFDYNTTKKTWQVPVYYAEFLNMDRGRMLEVA
jgi:uncharacterized protein